MFSLFFENVSLRVFLVGVVVPHQVRQDKSQERRLQEIDQQVLGVGEFALYVAREEHPELPEDIGDLERARRYLGVLLVGVDVGLDQLFVVLVPCGGIHFPVVREVAVLVEDLAFDDVEDLLGVHVAAVTALAFVGVHVVHQPFEVAHGVNRIAVINGITAHVEDH